jgi:hypothetical protein
MLEIRIYASILTVMDSPDAVFFRLHNARFFNIDPMAQIGKYATEVVENSSPDSGLTRIFKGVSFRNGSVCKRV